MKDAIDFMKAQIRKDNERGRCAFYDSSQGFDYCLLIADIGCQNRMEDEVAMISELGNKKEVKAYHRCKLKEEGI